MFLSEIIQDALDDVRSHDLSVSIANGLYSLRQHTPQRRGKDAR